MNHFNSPSTREQEDVDYVVNFFNHKREDTIEWLSSVKWAEGLAQIEQKAIKDTLEWVVSVAASPD